MKNTQAGNTVFTWGKRTYVMGIINVSPDSFSGDGVTLVENALMQARRFVEEGADILDIGGESTRPNFKPVTESDELKRVIPVIEKIATTVKIPVSVDTMKYEVARQSLLSGAAMLNDQWGLKKEPRLAELAAKYNVPIILMSNQRDIGGYDAGAGRDTASYSDVMAEVLAYLRQSISLALKSGVKDENIIIDPGIGFGKTWQQDIEIIRRLDELKVLGKPVLLGTSRKSLIKMVLNLPANDRVEGTAATVALGIAHGADIVRVHDVKQMVRVCKMADAIVRGI
ncbi:MAG: dihydropteroate synthase [Dehalococcoidales bacterium]|nr:dihydropteroate synthase [Dehalococcoidales bacterium]